jgi:hypothetical protein
MNHDSFVIYVEKTSENKVTSPLLAIMVKCSAGTKYTLYEINMILYAPAALLVISNILKLDDVDAVC